MPIYKMEGKKNGKQKYRVRVNYQDAFGKSKQIDRVAFGLEEAKYLEHSLSKEAKEVGVDKRMTVKELHEEYLKVKASEIRESTLDKHKRTLEHHIIPVLGQTKLSQLNAPVLQKWKTGIDNKGLALRTKQNAYSALRAMLNYAIRMDYLAKNPLNKIGNFKNDAIEVQKIAEPTRIDYYTSDEFLKFITVAKKHAQQIERKNHSLFEWNYYAFFAIAFYTGMRKGEINALQWSDIDGSLLSVRRSITQKLKGEDRVTPPKNRSSIRTLCLPEPLVQILDKHKSRWELLPGFKEDFHVCGGESALRDSTIQRKNEIYAKEAGIKSIRIHDFRHSHASLLANEGINIQEIARRLGHAKVEMTWNTYSHLYPREEERALAVLNRILL